MAADTDLSPGAALDPDVQARAAGYSWDEIDQYTGDRSLEAHDAGYTQDEIDQHLGFQPPQQMSARLQSQWSANPDSLADLSLPQPKLDLTKSPTWRGDYANALLSNEVKGPQDFADSYAAAALAGADGLGMLAANQADTYNRIGAETADAMSALLPGRRDLIDASLMLAPDPSDDQHEDVRQNLMSHWMDTGQDPLTAATQALNDQTLSEKLMASTRLPPMTGFGGFGNVLETPTAAERIGELTSGQISDAINKVYFMPGEELGDEKSVKNFLEDAGIDAATYTGFEVGGRYIVAPLVRAAIEKLGEIPEFLRGLADKTPITHVDLGAEPSEAVTTRPATEAFAPVQPAREAAAFGIPEERVSPGGTAFRRYPIEQEGENIGHMNVTFPTKDSAYIEDMRLNAGDQLGKNALGPSDMRQLFRQFFIDHPDIDTVEGVRASGAREEAGAPSQEITMTREQAMRGQREFAADATPAQKIEALARDGMNFDDMARAYPETRDLVKGWQARGGLLNALGRLIGDESGALNLPSLPSSEEFPETMGQVSKRGAKILGMDAADQLIRNSQQQVGRYLANTADRLEGLRKNVEPFMKEWVRELQTPGGDPTETVLGHMIRYINGDPTITFGENSPLTPVIEAFKELNDRTFAKIKDAADRGVVNPVNYVENYFRGLWENPNKADTFANSGRFGTSASWRGKVFPTFADGLNAGLRPPRGLENPIDIVLQDISGKLRYVAHMETLQEAANRGWVHWIGPGQEAPEWLERITGPGTEKPIPHEAYSQFGVNDPNAQLSWKAYAEPGFSKLWNNWTSLGFQGGAKTVIDQLNYVKNTTTGIRLALPLFHAMSIAHASVAGGVADVLNELGYGLTHLGSAQGWKELGHAAIDTAMTATVLPKMAQQMIQGWKGYNRYLDLANMDKDLDLVLRGNPNFFGKRQEAYQVGKVPSLITSAMRGSLGRELGEDFGRVNQIPGATWRMVQRIVTQISAPLMDHAVPMIKAGTTLEHAQTFLRQNPQASQSTIWKAARQAVDNADDRMGEFNTDNLFWNKAAKQTAQLSMVSPSWVVGTFRQLFAAFGWRVGRGTEWNPYATGGLIGLVGAHVLFNIAYQYLKTGSAPWQTSTPIADLAFPRTGGRNETNTGPARAFLPSEIKEALDIGKVVMQTVAQTYYHGPIAGALAFTGGAYTYAWDKFAPIWDAVHTLVTGVDNNNVHIAYSPNTIRDFLMNHVGPAFISNWQENPNPKSGVSAPERVAGIREVGNWIDNLNQFWNVEHAKNNNWTKSGIREQRWLGYSNGTYLPR